MAENRHSNQEQDKRREAEANLGQKEAKREKDSDNRLQHMQGDRTGQPAEKAKQKPR